jgi:hypothetical protein
MGRLHDRFNRTDLFALVPQHGLRFEPQLERLDRLPADDPGAERSGGPLDEEIWAGLLTDGSSALESGT